MIHVLFGVAGTGKTRIGLELARRLELPFLDADDFHPPSNVERMRLGVPLTDADRAPWLASLATEFARLEATGGAVVACSALREVYRERLASQCRQIVWILLDASPAVLQRRLAERRGHFFHPALLQSQLDALEIPAYGHRIAAEGPVDSVVSRVLSALTRYA